METFDGVIVEADRGGADVELPPTVVAALGGKGRIPVQATFDGVAYTGSVVSMGGARVLGLRTDIRQQLGTAPDDGVTVTVGGTFDALSCSHQREYVQGIDEAKRPETRARRIAQTVERLAG